MSITVIDRNSNKDIMPPEEVAQYLRKSLSWVYKNWKIVGGRKLGGTLFFPGKEKLHEHIFCQKEGVEVRLHPKQSKVFRRLVQDQTRGKRGRGKKEGGDKQPKTDNRDPNRHGLL